MSSGTTLKRLVREVKAELEKDPALEGPSYMYVRQEVLNALPVARMKAGAAVQADEYAEEEKRAAVIVALVDIIKPHCRKKATDAA